MSSSLIPVFEKLRGRENYNDWAFAMKAYLQHEDLWTCIIGEDTTVDAAEKARREIKAKSKIIMLIESQNYIHIRNAGTAKQVWDNLKQAFEDSGLTRKVGLMRKLLTTKLNDCNSLEEYISILMSTAQKLNDIKFEISSEWIGTLMLAGLPEQYNPMVMAIENSNISITADYIKTKLLQEVKPCENVQTENSVFYTANNRSKPNKHFRYKPRCYNCNNYGHIAKDCKKSNKKEHKNKNAEKSLFSLLSANNSVNSEDWIIDSGASTHMCSDLKHFIRSSCVTNKKEVMFADGRTVPFSK